MSSEEVANLRDAVRLLTKRLGLFDKAEASCCGVTLSQCYALIEIGHKQGVSINDLAVALGLDKSTASRTVDNLAMRGLVKREQELTDRRYLKVKLTEHGKQFFEEIEARMDNYYRKVYQSIPQDKRKQVLESIELLADVLDRDSCC